MRLETASVLQLVKRLLVGEEEMGREGFLEKAGSDEVGLIKFFSLFQ